MAIAGLTFSITRRVERTVTVIADLIEKVRIMDNVPLALGPFDDAAFAAWLSEGIGKPPPILGSIMEFPACCGRDSRIRLIAFKDATPVDPSTVADGTAPKFNLQAVCMACGDQWLMKGCSVVGCKKESYVP